MFPIELAVSEVRVGEQVVFTGIVRDISKCKELEKEILQVSEREQRRIAQELHEGVCQQLSGVALLASAMQRKLQSGDAISEHDASTVTRMLQHALRHARALSHGLAPVDPQRNGLVVALARLAYGTSQSGGVTCQFCDPQRVEISDSAAATHLYRIAQEAVRDATQSGKALNILIELARQPQGVELVVSDDGTDPDLQSRFADDITLHLMNHRARVAGATLKYESQKDTRGLRLVCALPD